MADSSAPDVGTNMNMAQRGGSLPRAAQRIPCVSYFFLKVFSSKKGGMASIFSPLHFPTSQPLPFVCILGGGMVLGVENLVAVLLPPTLHASFPFLFFFLS